MWEERWINLLQYTKLTVVVRRHRRMRVVGHTAPILSKTKPIEVSANTCQTEFFFFLSYIYLPTRCCAIRQPVPKRGEIGCRCNVQCLLVQTYFAELQQHQLGTHRTECQCVVELRNVVFPCKHNDVSKRTWHGIDRKCSGCQGLRVYRVSTIVKVCLGVVKHVVKRRTTCISKLLVAGRSSLIVYNQRQAAHRIQQQNVVESCEGRAGGVNWDISRLQGWDWGKLRKA